MNDFLDENITTIDKLNTFLFVFENDIPHDQYICNNLHSATTIFDLLNNRGTGLNETDVIRNAIIRMLDEKDRDKYFKKLENMFDVPNNINLINLKITDSSKTINTFLKIIYCLTNNKLENIFNISDKFRNYLIIETNETNDNKFNDTNFQDIETNTYNFEKYCNYMINNNYGQIFLLDNMLEIFISLIIPFFKLFFNNNNFDKVFNNYLEILICYQIKTCTGMRNYKYIKKQLYEFGNKIYNKQFDITNICSNLVELIKTIYKEKDDFVKLLINKHMPTNNYKKILLYYELKNRPTGFTIDITNIDIEHIMAKSTNHKLIDKIGNLTLFEKGNSNGQLGNRSLQDNKYKDKKKDYAKSNFNITKNIKEEKLNEWTENDINTRTKKIVYLINNYINTVLNITSVQSNLDDDISDDDNNSDDESSDDNESSDNDVNSDNESSDDNNYDDDSINEKVIIKTKKNIKK
jgi:hypothetical protein